MEMVEICPNFTIIYGNTNVFMSDNGLKIVKCYVNIQNAHGNTYSNV